MEAATPLRHAHIAILGDRLVVDGLVVDDETAVRLVRMRQDAAQRQDGSLGRLEERIAAMQVELQSLRDERDKQQEVEAERERGTAKGRTFEEAVFAAVAAVAEAQGDDCDAVGDLF